MRTSSQPKIRISDFRPLFRKLEFVGRTLLFQKDTSGCLQVGKISKRDRPQSHDQRSKLIAGLQACRFAHASEFSP